MDKALIEKHYRLKLKEYEGETNPLRKEQIKQEAIDLRIQLGWAHPKGGCYVDGKTVDMESDLFPFCSTHCHERWSKLNKYGEKVIKGAADIDIRKRQVRAIEIAGEKRQKRLGGMTI